MAGKHDTTEPSWRPLAQKLSGLIIRHNSSGKNKKSPTETATDEKGSVFKFKKQKKAPSPESPLEYEPLEVDLDKLEAIHLSDGWLETHTQDSDHDREQQQQQQQQQNQQPLVVDNTTTPIADLFSNKSVLNVSDSGQLKPSSGSFNHGRSGSRPFSMVEFQSAKLPSVRDAPPATGSILSRGRPVEPRRYVSDPPKKTKGLLSLQGDTATAAVVEKAATLNYDSGSGSSSGSSSSGSLTAKQNETTSQLQPPRNADSANRHSMYAGGLPSLNSVPAKTRTAQASTRSASATPLDRIQTWQKSITSAPMSTASSASASTPSAPGSALAPGIPSSQAAAPQVRRVPARGGGGVTGSRLAWIRELEEKKSGSVGRDLPVLKKQAGSVSDKLALFESKQGRAASPASRLPPLARSNSTTSRLSSVGLESTSSAYGDNAATTPRTSIDTVRSSHRASSVMNYYDDSFREKMESIAGEYTPADKEKDKSDAQEKPRVTAQFVPVKAEKEEEVEAKPQPCQPEAGPSNVEPEKKGQEEDLHRTVQSDAATENVSTETENVTNNEA